MSRWSSIPGLAWRESRTARRRLLLYMSSISLGVAALVAIDSIAANVQGSVREQTRNLMGGDVSFSANQKFPEKSQKILDSLSAHGTPVARVVTFVSMALALRSGTTRLTQVRAADGQYPPFGDVTTEPPGLWPRLQQGQFALTSPSTLIALDATVGDTITIGYTKFVIIGTATSVPGDPGLATAIGPRVFIAEKFVPETQLLGFGSRASYEAVVKLPNGVASAKWVAPLRPKFQAENVRVVTVAQREQNLTESIGQLADFLGIVGLIALLLGGIGVASGVNAFVVRKIDTVAVLRCVGATSSQVLAIYVTQAAVMGLLGAALGVGVGVAIQFALPVAVREYLPLDVHVRVVPGAIGMGLAIGVWVALIFALRPLLVLRRVSPLQALRRDAEALETQRRRDVPSHLVNLALVSSVVLLAMARADSWRRGALFAAGIGASLMLLWGSAALLSVLARRAVTPRWPYVVRQGVANLYRPANQTRSVVLALGFGAFLVSTLYLVQANLLKQFNVTAAASKGNLIFFDIQEDQRAGIDSIVRAQGQQLLGSAAIVTMKVAMINGRTPERWAAS
ncbi:MAG: ABC transporter permease, partial [Gemmatimonadales bacterium]